MQNYYFFLIYASIWVFFIVFLGLSVRQRRALFICLFICLYVCLFVCMFICLYVHYAGLYPASSLVSLESLETLGSLSFMSSSNLSVSSASSVFRPHGLQTPETGLLTLHPSKKGRGGAFSPISPIRLIRPISLIVLIVFLNSKPL